MAFVALNTVWTSKIFCLVRDLLFFGVSLAVRRNCPHLSCADVYCTSRSSALGRKFYASTSDCRTFVHFSYHFLRQCANSPFRPVVSFVGVVLIARPASLFGDVAIQMSESSGAQVTPTQRMIAVGYVAAFRAFRGFLKLSAWSG